MPSTTSTDSKTSSDALATLFASKARARVLKLFMLDPRRAFYQRQIESATGLAIRAVQRELERLAKVGLLYRHTQGNRAYYQVDQYFPLFKHLREMILAVSTPFERLRGALAFDPRVRLAFCIESESRVLAVTADGRSTDEAIPSQYHLETMSEEAFVRALSEDASAIDAYLREGVDLLGRREDLVWRRIEAAGYECAKGKDVV
jgi:DNA-binding transcriptional ArsR family regulator